MSFKCMNDAKVVDGQHLLRLIRAADDDAKDYDYYLRSASLS